PLWRAKEGRTRLCANSKSAHARHVEEFPRAWHWPDRHLDQRWLAGGKGGLERQAKFLRVARAAARGAEAFGVFDEVRIGEVGCDHPVAEVLLLDAPHIAVGAVAADREHRHARPRVLRAERGGISPAKIVLVAGREKSTRSIDRKLKPGGEADLRHVVHIDAVFRQFGADDVEEGELRREPGHALP